MRAGNFISTINVAAALFSGACMACAACEGYPAVAEVHAQTSAKTVDRTVPLVATGSVVLETHNGSLDVHTWDRPEIEIHARIEAAGVSADDLRRFDETTVEVSPMSSGSSSGSDSVRITSKSPDVVWSWFGENPTVHYAITAPRTARWTIRGHNFRAEIRDLQAALNVGTHNGSLHAVNLDGPLEVNGHNERVTVEFLSFHGADITTHNGSADLALPSTSHFDLRADTRRTRLESDFPLLTRTLGRRQDRIEGTVNGGGSLLRFSSHNGELRLRSK